MPPERALPRRRALLLGAAGALGVRPASALPGGPDLAGYRLSFATRFSDPAAPLFVKDGGPFTTRYEQWGGLRTLPGNRERQLYVDQGFVPAPAGTDRQGGADGPAGGAPLGYDPFAVRGGALDITAVPAPPGDRARIDRPYLSGMVSTEWSFAQRFGYFEMQAQLPAGRGLWPAFWMVSNTASEHIEIDVMEGLGHDVQHVYQSLHVAAARGATLHERIAMPGAPYAAGMHTYGVQWTDRELIYYIDGRETLRADGAPLRSAPPMYLIANLAVGGNWGGDPDASTPFPAVLRIGHIRAWAPA